MMRSGYLVLNGHEPWVLLLLGLCLQKKSIFRQVHYTPLNSLQLEAAQAKEVLLIVHRI